MARGEGRRNLEEEMSKELIEELRVLSVEVRALRRALPRPPDAEEPVHRTRFISSLKAVDHLARQAGSGKGRADTSAP
jgi:hypothetical protein